MTITAKIAQTTLVVFFQLPCYLHLFCPTLESAVGEWYPKDPALCPAAFTMLKPQMMSPQATTPLTAQDLILRNHLLLVLRMQSSLYTPIHQSI